MENFLFTYEMYWMEIAGVLMVAVLVLMIVLLRMICVLHKRLRQMGDRLHLKSEVENSRRRDLVRGTRAAGQYGVRSEAAYSGGEWRTGNPTGRKIVEGEKMDIKEIEKKLSINCPENNFDIMKAENGEEHYRQKRNDEGELDKPDAAGERELILDVLGEIFP